ncbi:hypothetical protein FIBSPDRAFT_924477 [Athelia psychrophila]|uniref:Uncharacterized protein n=1 Tax=Athelia psychrophila TaxID=1759441 RepID=A0A166W845_9AGAM|nr:hypothetical protein FIBSPDRAFT_924477 [Fibularhizoctonia sp. CBS 109695]
MIFILLFLHYLATLHADALPTPTADFSVLAGFVNISPSCRYLGPCRELSSIIWSCLTTIFACIWFAQHPNVPPPSWSRLHKLGYAAMDTFIIMIVPDIMLARAIREFISAGAVAKKLNVIERERKIVLEESDDEIVDMQMGEGDGDGEGGDTATLVSVLPMYGGNNPQLAPPEKRRKRKGSSLAWGGYIYTARMNPFDLTIEDFTYLADHDVFPMPRPDDIDDRSKRSWISKGLAIMQTVSFTTQCVARLAVRLPITELELTALAYTMVTVLAYFIWWKKPVNIRRPVRVLSPCPVVNGEAPKSTIQYMISALATKREFADTSVRLLIVAVTTAMGSAFGAIHCIYWWTSSTYWHDQNRWYNHVAFLITILPVAMITSSLAHWGGYL